MATMQKFQFLPRAPEWAGEAFNVAIVTDSRIAAEGYQGRRFLIVLEEIDSEDLRAGVLLSRNAPASKWVPAAEELALQYAQAAGKKTPKNPAVMYANFNFTKTYDLPLKERDAVGALAADRIIKLVNKFKITDIMILGDNAAYHIYNKVFPDLDFYNALRTRGNPRKDAKGRLWTNTITLNKAYSNLHHNADDDSEEGETLVDIANLLGFVSRCVANFYIGDLVYRAENVQPKPILIDTPARFERMFEQVYDADVVSVDTETTTLGRTVNDVLTIQFATDSSRGFVVPIKHKDAPWKGSQLDHIEKRLRQLFSKKKNPLDTDLSQYTIWQNAKFDVSVIRNWLQLHHFAPRLWDVMAGQYLLDENLKTLNTPKFGVIGIPKTSPYSLDNIAAWYGIDFYLNADVSKHNRGNIANMDLNKAVLEYASMDAQVLHAISKQQQLIASNFKIEGKSWGEGFKKMMLLQMYPIIYVESIMEHRGDQLDITYMMDLLDKGSEFQQAKQKLLNEFSTMESVQNVNKQLLAESQHVEVDLFGQQQFVFSIAKQDHKERLFVGEMGLEPVSYGKSGAPSFDKAFQATYSGKHPEVALFHKVASAQTVESTYIKAFYKRVATDEDMSHDHRLRASYGFTGTVTGRSNSYSPNLQNIPQRGEFAKFIKRAFVASRGSLILKLDYCVDGDALIPTDKGLVPLKSLCPTDFVKRPVEIKVKTVSVGHRLNTAVYATYMGKKPTLQLITEHFNRLCVTPDHRMLVLRNGNLTWVQAQDCKLGDLMCMSRTPSIRAGSPLSSYGNEIGAVPFAVWYKMTDKQRESYEAANCYVSALASITAGGLKDVYDLTMSDRSRPVFTANGFLVHNCAHEVRMLGVVSKDSTLCGLFVLGRWLTQMYRKTGLKAFKQWRTTIGDIHKLNVAFFYKTTAEAATKEQRDSVKSIVFGLIYGRGAKAIASQAKADIKAIKELMVKFFERFTAAGDWLSRVKKMCISKGFSFSPIGRVRHMTAHLFGIDSLVAATERRGPNAAIQSIAADIGHTSAYLYHMHILRVCRKWGLDDSRILKAGLNAFVHDAIKTEAPYEYFLVCAQVFQWCATNGAMEYYKKHWGLKFYVEIEVEIEVAAHDDMHWKWDWFDGNVGDDESGGLDYIIRKALIDQKAVYPDLDVKEAYRKIMAIKKNKPLMEWLNKEYPILQDWPDATRVSPKDVAKYMKEAKEKENAKQPE